MRIVLALTLGLALAACGTKKEESNDQPQTPELTQAEKADMEEKFTSVPAAAVVRVKIDENGNAVGEPEMRVSTGGTDTSDDAVVAAFDNGTAPQSMVSSESELDGDTSTQSWHRWNRCYNRCGNYYRHNYWFGSYVPRLYYHGYNWRYRRGNWCRRGGYNYYYYGARRYW